MKTAELIGPALDWAVAKCGNFYAVHILKVSTQIMAEPLADEGWYSYSPSTNWSQGGPIIERENISVIGYTDQWEACADVGIYVDNYQGDWISGPTALIAAMRCYVASKIGDEVEIPKEFL